MKKWRKFVFASDLHGCKLHQPTVDRLFKFMEDFGPDIVIFGGDLIDFAPFRRGATKDETEQSTDMDVHSGWQFFEQYFDRKADVRINHDGNHDYRLEELAMKATGVAGDWARAGVDDKRFRHKRLKVDNLPYHNRKGIYQLGHLKTLHGFHAGLTAARQHALVYGACLFGHTHTRDEAATAGIDRRVARGAGCLCELDLDYNNRNTGSLRQAHGWLYGHISSDTGEYFVSAAEERSGVWNIDLR
jgi:predicted phosphodiesterase